MPAEWEPQAAVWYSWPHRHRTWPGNFRPIPAKFAEIVATVAYDDTRRPAEPAPAVAPAAVVSR